MLTNFRGWLVCGPIGHLVAGVVDFVAVLLRYGWARRHTLRSKFTGAD